MLPGGGFYGISPEDLIGMIKGTKDNLALRLALDLDAEVFVINYATVPDLKILATVAASDTCSFIQNETGKALTLDASYKAFHDLRRLLKTEFLDKAAMKNIDPNNFFMIGSSAGAVLAINSLFLQQSEIPSSITYKSVCGSNTTNTIIIDPSIKNEYWPIPTMKGIVTMAGAWIYDNVSHLTANTPASSFNTPLYMMHGTCDEIIFRKDGRIGFRAPVTSNNQNLAIASKFLSGKGSEYIFNVFKYSHNKMGYGQVLKGGHLIFSNPSVSPVPNNYWDFVPNLGSNTIDPVTAHIKPFIEDLKNGVSTWVTHTEIWNPEKPSTKCQDFDFENETICFEYIPVPNISYDNHICNYNNYTATITNLPVTPYTISWTALGNIQLVGATNGTSVQYKRLNSSILFGTLRLTLTKGCSSRVFDYKVNITGEDLLDIYMESECYEGGMGSITRRLPPGNNATFTAQYPNAANDGITSLAWQFNCGYIVGAPTQYYIGTTLYSTIQCYSQTPCTDVRVRKVNECGDLSGWTIKYLDSRACNLALRINPNPSESFIQIELSDKNEAIKSEEGIPVVFVDAMGEEYLKTTIFSTEEKIDVSKLKAGVYKVVVTYERETFFTSIIKN